MLVFQPAGNLLRRPVQNQFTYNDVPQVQVDRKKAALGPQGRLPGFAVRLTGSIRWTATMTCDLPAHCRYRGNHHLRLATTKKLIIDCPGLSGRRWRLYFAPSSAGCLTSACQPCCANRPTGSSVPNRQPIPRSSMALSTCCIHGLVSKLWLTRSVTSKLHGAARPETSLRTWFTAGSSR